jgi:hypothetical protein
MVWRSIDFGRIVDEATGALRRLGAPPKLSAVGPVRLGIGVVASLVLLFSLIVIVMSLRGPRIPTDAQVYFYDLNEGTFFVGSLMDVPPIPRRSGPLPNGEPAGVRAHLFACGDCGPPENLVGYLETTRVSRETGEPVRVRAAFEPGDRGDPEWILAESGLGEDIENRLRARCPEGVELNSCLP